MRKTSVCLPDELKSSLERLSALERRSEAAIIRDALRAAVEKANPPRLRLPITSRGLGDRSIAERLDDVLEGFGGR